MLGIIMLPASCHFFDKPGTTGNGNGNGESPPTLTPSGVAIIKFRSSDSGWAALNERLRAIEDLTTPDRQLLVSTDSNETATTIDPPVGWSLIDFAIHPSGEITLALASDRELHLQRRTARGELLGESNFTDSRAATDPFIGDTRTIKDSESLVPQQTRDSVRVAANGDDVILVMRTGRNALVAQRLAYVGNGQFQSRWRTLVEPGVPIDMVRLTSGTFDPFGNLDNQWQLVLDVDDQGRSAIAVSLGHTQLPAGHRQYFGESIDPDLVSGAMLTVLDATGVRLSATPIRVDVPAEVHAVRWIGDTILVGGRMFTTQKADGSGWDAYLARYRFGDPAAQLKMLDFDRGDVILDVTPLDDGRIAIAGSTGYTQNPTGGSVSEDDQPLLAVMTNASSTAQRVTVTGGLRQNQVRTLATWRGHFLIGGFKNGPGTHSGDVDAGRLTCDGFLREQDL